MREESGGGSMVPDQLRHPLVVINESAHRFRALRVAVEAATRGRGRLTITTNVSPLPQWAVLAGPDVLAAALCIQPDLVERASELLRHAAMTVPSAIPLRTTLTRGPLEDSLLAATQRGEHDAVILGGAVTGATRLMSPRAASRLSRRCVVPVFFADQVSVESAPAGVLAPSLP